MDFLSKAYAQLSDLFRSMTVGARITTAVLLAVVVLSVGYLFTFHVSGPDTYLLGGRSFTTRELDQVQAALAQAGLGSFVVEGSRVKIPSGQQAQYVAAMADGDALPVDFAEDLLKVLGEASPFIGSEQRRAQEKAATLRLLSSSISQLEGIESAHVFYDVKEKKTGFKKETIASATVKVTPLSSRPLSPEKIRAVRSIVSGMVAEISPKQVSVVNNLSGRTYVGTGEDGAGSALDDPFISFTRDHEERYRTKVAQALDWVPGVTVAVNVELYREVNNSEESITYDGQPLALTSDSQTRKSSASTSSPGGRPGPAAQLPLAPNSRAAVTQSSKMTDQENDQQKEKTESVVDTTRSSSERPDMTPEKVSVSIGVPRSYYVSLWQQENPPPEGEEPKQPSNNELAEIEQREGAKIRDYVLPIITVPDKAVPTDIVYVASFTEVPMADLPVESMATGVVTWLASNWSTVGMIVLVLLSLMMLRSMIRSAPPEMQTVPEPRILSFETGEEVPPVETPQQKVARTLKRRSEGEPNLRDELAEMVREDPDAAATILRSWIGNTG
jgi:flagellar M-ring protein FliF